MDQKSKYKKRATVESLDIGKVTPQAIDLEEAVLGSLLLESKEVSSILFSTLTEKTFYKDAHEIIFLACKNLFVRSEPIDILTVTQELKKTGQLDTVGGAYYITQLTNRVASSANTEFHARILQQKFMLRELIRISTKAISGAFDDTSEVFELLANSEKDLFDITKNLHKEPETSLTLANKVVKELEKIAQRQDGLSGIPSGLTSLDRLTSGWQKSDLVIIAARPAMGKTALAVTIAKNAAMVFNKPVAIFSLEMSKAQIMKRLIASEAEIDGYLLKQPRKLESYHWEKINKAVGDISNAPLFIDDTPGISVFELKAKARRLKEKYGVELIVVDYMQLMTTGIDNQRGNREQEISYISRNLKGLAKDLEIPVIALSQLSRAVETRGGDKRPQLSDLRESGAIEQDADMVIFPHRAEYYGITEDSAGNSTIGKAELIIAKHREGGLDDALVQYQASFTKFCDVDEYNHSSPVDYTTPRKESIEANDNFLNENQAPVI